MEIICNLFLLNCSDNFPHPPQELSEGTIKILVTPNAGGDSKISEALSLELFYREYDAELLKVILIVYIFTISCLTNETVGEFVIYILKLDSANAAVFNFNGQTQMKFVIYISK